MKKYKVDIWSEEIDEGDGVDFENGWNTGYNADWDVTSVEEIK